MVTKCKDEVHRPSSLFFLTACGREERAYKYKKNLGVCGSGPYERELSEFSGPQENEEVEANSGRVLND